MQQTRYFSIRQQSVNQEMSSFMAVRVHKNSPPMVHTSSPNLYTTPLETVRILFSYVRQDLHSVLLRLGFIARFLYVFLVPPSVLQNLPSTFLDLITLIFREKQKLWSFSLRSFFQPHVTSCVFQIQIFYWQLIFLPAEWNQCLIDGIAKTLYHHVHGMSKASGMWSQFYHKISRHIS